MATVPLHHLPYPSPTVPVGKIVVRNHVHWARQLAGRRALRQLLKRIMVTVSIGKVYGIGIY